jgi:pyrophosphatase PpaX
MRYETVLFDLDGTLIDSGALILASFKHATETVLGRTYPDDVLLANVGGHGLDHQMRIFDEALADELVRVYREHNLSIYAKVTMFAGVESVLGRLEGEGRRLGVVTVKSRPTVQLTFEVLPLGRYFGAVVTGDDTARHKPHPEPLLRALNELQADPATAAYVGDSPFDIQAARAAGMAAIAVGWGGIHDSSRLLPLDPDVLVERPEELLDVL